MQSILVTWQHCKLCCCFRSSPGKVYNTKKKQSESTRLRDVSILIWCVCPKVFGKRNTGIF